MPSGDQKHSKADPLGGIGATGAFVLFAAVIALVVCLYVGPCVH